MSGTIYRQISAVWAAEVWLSLSCEVREELGGTVAAGGSANDEPTDYGVMYQHGFADADGHQWVLFHMTAMPPQELHPSIRA